jgi:hypothetical protein
MFQRKPAGSGFQILSGNTPRPRYKLGEVPFRFVPVYVTNSVEIKVARYPCTASTRTLTGEVRQYLWVGKKSKCAQHRKHIDRLPPGSDPQFHLHASQSLNRQKLHKRILSLAAPFVAATNLSFRQGASPAMHDFIIRLIQLGASLPRDALDTIVVIPPLIDEMTDCQVAEAVHQNADLKFQAAIDKLADLHFVNLVLDSGTVFHLKTIPGLMSNPYCSEPPVLLTLRENKNFIAGQYAEMFWELFATIESAGLSLCSVMADNLPAQSSGLVQVLTDTESPVIHVKCFAHMANLALSHTASTANFSVMMTHLTELQGLLRCRSAHEVVGAKCPRFIRTRWFYITDALVFIFNRVDVIAEFLHSISESESIRPNIPTELFELYTILIPFASL